MADNYLEKKFEEHARGKAKMFRAPGKKTRTVFVADGLSPEGERRVKELAAEGTANVAFAGAERKRGYALAQATGARFYPLQPLTLEAAIADAKVHWRGVPFYAE